MCINNSFSSTRERWVIFSSTFGFREIMTNFGCYRVRENFIHHSNKCDLGRERYLRRSNFKFLPQKEFNIRNLNNEKLQYKKIYYRRKCVLILNNYQLLVDTGFVLLQETHCLCKRGTRVMLAFDKDENFGMEKVENPLHEWIDCAYHNALF